MKKDKKKSALENSFQFNWIKLLNYFHLYNYKDVLDNAFDKEESSKIIFILLKVRPDIFEDKNQYGKLAIDCAIKWKDQELLKAILKSKIKNNPINLEISFERLKYTDVQINYLIWAHKNNFNQAETIIANHISDHSYYFSFIYALLKNDKDWFSFFDLNRCFDYAKKQFGPKPDVNPSIISQDTKWVLDRPFKLKLTPITAAILGHCEPETLKKLWKESPDELKNVYYVYSEGYGHDNDPVYGGYPEYWAQIIGYKNSFNDLIT